MSADQLEVFLADNRSAYRPGETVRGSVLWALATPPETLEVRLFWRTQGKGTSDVEIVATHAVSRPAAAGEEAFTFVLPEAPWSFSGKLVSLSWGLEGVAEPGGQNAQAPLVLAPHGREILLTPVDDAARS